MINARYASVFNFDPDPIFGFINRGTIINFRLSENHQEAKLFMLDLEPIKKKKIIMAKGFDSVRNVCFSFFKCLHLIENKAIYTF